MANVMKACILMNNIIVEARRDNYESGMYEAAESSADAAEVDSITFLWQDRVLCAAKDETSVDTMRRIFCCNFLRKS
jgi:hypothetical protein